MLLSNGRQIFFFLWRYFDPNGRSVLFFISQWITSKVVVFIVVKCDRKIYCDLVLPRHAFTAISCSPKILYGIFCQPEFVVVWKLAFLTTLAITTKNQSFLIWYSITGIHFTPLVSLCLHLKRQNSTRWIKNSVEKMIKFVWHFDTANKFSLVEI